METDIRADQIDSFLGELMDRQASIDKFLEELKEMHSYAKKESQKSRDTLKHKEKINIQKHVFGYDAGYLYGIQYALEKAEMMFTEEKGE